MSGIKGINVGSKNGQWKGASVGYSSLHNWVGRNKLKPKKCESCLLVPGRDWANISQKYKRNLADWEWLCRSCHMKKDGRGWAVRNYWKGKKWPFSAWNKGRTGVYSKETLEKMSLARKKYYQNLKK